MKIFCIGRNYSEHAKEMSSAVPTKPIVFMKPATAICDDSRPYYIPEWTEELHHEVEVVYRIAKNGKAIHPDFYKDYIDGVSLGIDFTARDIQQQCKDERHPWEVSKAFDKSALISPFVSVEEFESKGGAFDLIKNGETVQSGDISQMIFDIKTLLVYISQFFTLQKGDLIYTGTPAGVGKLASGDILVGRINGEEAFNLKVK